MISSIYNDGGYKVKPKKLKNAKNRVQNGSEQRPQDAFYTPLAVFEAIKMLILKEFEYSNVLYDPACGKGAAKEAFPFNRWILHDKFPCEGATTPESIDFEFSEVTKFDCLITNPPFSRIYPFIKKAYKLGKPFCLLLPNYVIYKRGVLKLFHLHGVHKIDITDRPKWTLPSGKTLLSDGRATYSWFCGNFDFIKKGLSYEARFFMTKPFKTGPPLTQDSQMSQVSQLSQDSQVSELEFEEELEESEPDNHFICSGCDYVSFDEDVHPHECPKCNQDFCRKCIVWYLGGNIVEEEFEAGDDPCFLCKDCSTDPITDGDESTTDDGSFHPVVRGLDGNEVFNGHTDF